MIITCKTDKGRVRDINEDYVLTMKSDYYYLIIVADGMGGHNAGEIASKLASTSIREYIFSNFSSYEDKEELVREAILKSNMDVYNIASNNEMYNGMGTTVTMCLICEDDVYIGHVGDSRGYLINKKCIKKLTKDHSYVQELINNGSITENEAINHPQKNLITRAIGTEKYVNVDTSVIKINKGDCLLICSDGLTNYFDKDGIYNIVTSNYENAVDILVDEANIRGGSDNISVIIARKEE